MGVQSNAKTTKTVKRRPGPKGIYSAALIPRICELARAGMPQMIIARGLRVKPETFSDWLRKHDELAEAFYAARLEGAEERLRDIRDAACANGKPSWQASAWILQRMFPAEFGQPDAKAAPSTTNVSVTVISGDRLKEIQQRRVQALNSHGRN